MARFGASPQPGRSGWPLPEIASFDGGGGKVTAAILAGGRARRLGGRNKSLLRVGGETILARQLRELSGVAAQILLVAAGRPDHVSREVDVVPDLIAGSGALGGLYSALVAAAHDKVLVVGCDMPFLTSAFLARVVREADGFDAAMPRTSDGWQPLCACYARSCQTVVARRIESGQLRMLDLVGSLRLREISAAVVAGYDPYGDLLMNVNTPDDLALALIGARARGLET